MIPGASRAVENREFRVESLPAPRGRVSGPVDLRTQSMQHVSEVVRARTPDRKRVGGSVDLPEVLDLGVAGPSDREHAKRWKELTERSEIVDVARVDDACSLHREGCDDRIDRRRPPDLAEGHSCKFHG